MSRRTTYYNDDLKSSKDNLQQSRLEQQFAKILSRTTEQNNKKNCVEKVFAKFGKKLFRTIMSKNDPLQQFEKYCLEQHFATNWPGKQFA